MIRDHHEERERRTIIIERQEGSFGFTLQSYSIHYCKEKDVEIITYVDFVDPNGPALKAGLRSGDVIVSINGQDVERADHRTLVSLVQNCPARMRIVVVFENCVRKVELHMQFIQLQQELQKKIAKYNDLCAREKNLVSRYGYRRETSALQSLIPNTRENLCDSLRIPKPCAPAPAPASARPALAPPPPSLQQASGSDLCAQRESHQRRPSYSCTGSECVDCNCWRDLYYAKRSSKAEPSLVGSGSQRPKSCHLTSCYPSPSHRSNLSESERKERTTSGAYGGYGFGYSYQSEQQQPSSLKCYKRRTADYEYQQAGKLADPPYYRKTLPKSAEDLLSAQILDKCQITAYAPQHYTKVVEAQETLYRKRQPSSIDSLLESSDNYEPYPRRASAFRGQRSQMYDVYDPSAFDEPRSSRTLPLLKRQR